MKIYFHLYNQKHSPAQCGNKAAVLAYLYTNQHPVIPWVTLDSQALVEHLILHEKNMPVNRKLEGLAAENIPEIAACLQQIITDLPIIPQLEEELQLHLATPPFSDHEYFAVRSSATDEDGGNYSFAGMLSSYLYCSRKTLIEYIKKCWASSFSERALHYRLHYNLPVYPRIAVMIQAMVPASCSGVLFTRHWEQADCLVIHATFGLGEELVQGNTNPDEYFLSRASGKVIARNLDQQSTQLKFNPDSQQLERFKIGEKESKQSVLSPQQLQQLYRHAMQIEKLKGSAQDIEWAYHNNELFILQSRSITTRKEHKQVWSNANIQESYYGVTTPLTFSFASSAYARVYTQTMRAVRLPKKTIDEHQDMLKNLLGLVNGRIYYNINNWYRGILLLPSFRRNKEDMEQMMGLEEPVDYIHDQTYTPWQQIQRLPRLVLTYTRLLLQFNRLPALVPRFHREFNRHYRTVKEADYSSLGNHELYSRLAYLEKKVLDNWSTPIINDFYVMMNSGRLNRLLEKSGVENIDEIRGNLLSGVEEIESTQPTRQLMQLAYTIQQNDSLHGLFRKAAPNEIWGKLSTDFTGFEKLCRKFIDRYGDRTVGELKLETITMRQDPNKMITLLRQYIGQDIPAPEEMKARQQQKTLEAENMLFRQAMKNKGWLSVRKLKKALRAYRQGVLFREALRLERTRIFGLYRDIFLEIGKRMVQLRVLNHYRDIFYLTQEEISAWFEGRSLQTRFQELVSTRKKTFNAYQDHKPPSQFTTTLGLHTPGQIPEDLPEVTYSDNKVSGKPCYPGRVSAPAAVVLQPDEYSSLSGKILCAERTDPGWAPLFITCRGIIVENGSSLSHSAIIARELGIPAIVGLKKATQRIPDEKHITMDGGKGTVTWQN